MKTAIIVGTRPNFIKAFSLLREIKEREIDNILIHTGQHYDYEMNEIFFKELYIKRPDYQLEKNSVAIITFLAIAEILKKEKIDLVFSIGDVDSSLAAALAAKMYGCKLAHIEAGLRSFDNSMPEETNRMIIDTMSDFLFVTERSGMNNLVNSNIDRNKIFFVGNTMIDTLIYFKDKMIPKPFDKRYFVLTLHRRALHNNNIKITLQNIRAATNEDIIFPVHPHTGSLDIHNYDFIEKLPMGYLDFMNLVVNSIGVITDSGGIQEETSFLNIPCFTVRDNTERPITIEQGTNILVGADAGNLKKCINIKKQSKNIELWDGKSSERIFNILEKI